jgi:hypothetical protein
MFITNFIKLINPSKISNPTWLELGHDFSRRNSVKICRVSLVLQDAQTNYFSADKK